MTHDFREMTIGGVLFAPFVLYAAAPRSVVKS